jgi:hypothetical protein
MHQCTQQKEMKDLKSDFTSGYMGKNHGRILSYNLLCNKIENLPDWSISLMPPPPLNYGSEMTILWNVPALYSVRNLEKIKNN